MLFFVIGRVLMFSGEHAELLVEIEWLRRKLQELVEENTKSLQDQEIQAVSRELDSKLNEYNKFMDQTGGNRY